MTSITMTMEEWDAYVASEPERAAKQIADEEKALDELHARLKADHAREQAAGNITKVEQARMDAKIAESINKNKGQLKQRIKNVN